MKKNFNKIASLVLAAAMVGAMPVAAFADTNTTATTELRAKATISTTSDRTFEVYQIFTGDLSNGKLSNLKWGANGTGEEGDVVDEATINALTALDGKTDAEKLAVIESFAKMENPVGTVTKDASWTGRTGYYIFKDVTTNLKDGEAYSLNVTEVNGNTTITPKTGTTTSEKKVRDINDSTDTTVGGLMDSSDWDIGDEVPFQLKATIASDYANYTKGYKLTFHDHESAGLTFNAKSVVVKVDGNDVDTTAYSVATGSEKDNPCTFEVHFENLKDIKDVHAGSVITVDYTATLNENAKIGAEGNPNESHITFTNNPNDNQAGENGKTPDDKVIVFTYKVEANKYMNEVKKGNELMGAKFTLYKLVTDTSKKGAKKGADIKAELKSKDETKSVNTDAFVDASYYVSLGEVDGTTSSQFTWKGIDDGTYILVETKTPDGYNSKEAMSFEVTATHTDGEEPALETLNGYKITGDIVLTATKDDGKLSTDVINKQGSTLPTTGGMGTTILYVAGAILVIAGAAVLVIKKRHEA